MAPELSPILMANFNQMEPPWVEKKVPELSSSEFLKKKNALCVFEFSEKSEKRSFHFQNLALK